METNTIKNLRIIAKEKGFDIHPHDFDQFNNGDLIETDREDTFLKPSWWERISQQ